MRSDEHMLQSEAFPIPPHSNQNTMIKRIKFQSRILYEKKDRIKLWSSKVRDCISLGGQQRFDREDEVWDVSLKQNKTWSGKSGKKEFKVERGDRAMTYR